MNQEIEYAEMLEIPVSTVNVVRRRQKSGKKASSLQEELLDKINNQQEERVIEESLPTDGLITEETQETAAPSQDFATTVVEDAPLPTRWQRRRRLFLRLRKKRWDLEAGEKQTLEVGAQDKDEASASNLLEEEQTAPLLQDGETQLDERADERLSENEGSRAAKILYRIEFACACALCLGIFLTNVFLPGSAINTFFRTMTTVPNKDSRTYEDFTLSSIVGEYSTATVSVSAEGVISFTAEGCVYPCADGRVTDVLLADGAYVVKVEHSPLFTSVLTGVDFVYYAIGDEVKHNVPIAYSKGTGEVQMTMYDSGELLTCIQIDKQNCLTWAEEQK